jgi:hypothetical protein
VKKAGFFILICLILASCIKTTDKDLSKPEISKENIFAQFPDNPEYFNKNNIDVEIKKYDRQSPSEWRAYGMNQVHIKGDNFFIIYEYENDAAYEIMLVILYGESIFPYWNRYFSATWDDVKKSWGEADLEESRAYIDSTGWYGVVFTKINASTRKIEEIRISKIP